MRKTCPYNSMPETSFWSKSVARRTDVDPIIQVPFTIAPDDKIATAGSCFAQHIARYLSNSGYNYFVTENVMDFVDSETRSLYNYGTFPARFGNIYTSRQLLQLFRRAYGIFEPQEIFWSLGDAFVDPFRPFVQPNGFESVDLLLEDRRQHLAAVRAMFEEVDVFVFTFGLTECWENVLDGAVFPVCPGCGAGVFDPDVHKFRNLRYNEIVSDMEQFVTSLRSINPTVKFIFTVSLVPLVATATDGHVLPATIYSKSVLRAAAQDLAEAIPGSVYFPSYDIITSPQVKAAYYSSDLRSITEDGVSRVMSIFFKHFCPEDEFVQRRHMEIESAKKAENAARQKEISVICDEVQLELGR